MNKDQYLDGLKNGLRNIPTEEVNNIMEYYKEYFEDAGIENEQTVIAELGKPELVASKICADYVIKDIESHNEPIKNVAQVKKGLSDIWIMILAICAFPIWFPLVIAVAAVVFSLVIAVFSIVFAFVVASIAIVGSGIFALIVGICVLFIHMPTGLATLGTACVAIGFGFLFLVATVWMGNLFKNLILRITKIRIKKGVKNNEQTN